MMNDGAPLLPSGLQTAYGWSLPDGAGAAEHPAALAALPPELGWTRVALHRAQPDLRLAETWTHPLVPLTLSARRQGPQPFLVLSLQSRGASRVRHPDIGDGMSSPETWWFLRMTGDGAESHYENEVGVTTEVTTLTVTADRLAALLDGQRPPRFIEALLDGRFDPSGGAARMTATLRRILQQIRSNPYEGVMASLYLDGKILELLAEALTESAGDRAAGSRERRAALAARERLMEDLADPPSIEALAREVGLSQGRLTDLFRALFGATPFQCLSQWRLDQARSLLAEDALSVKQVAHRMGYAHVSSFSHAYARRFGAPPTGRR